MAIGLIFLVLALAIIFFHYIQGFFTSLFSAIIALMATGVAFAYYEPLTRLMKPTAFADYAPGLLMAVLFGATYIILRVIFDIVVPGNVRMQFTVDKIGAVVFGAVAAICSIGVLAVATQALPFGPTILGFSRYKVVDHVDISVQGIGDFAIDDALQDGTFKPEDRLAMPVAFDQWAIDFAGAMSNGGLAGTQSLYAIHPDMLQEEFANNLGYQAGARHAAWNYGDAPQVQLGGLQEAFSLRVVDDELPQVRDAVKWATPPPAMEKADSSQILLLVPITITADAVEADGASVARIATGSVRLVTPDKESATGYADHYPLGTVDLRSGILFYNKIDDPIFIDVSGSGRGTACFAFKVDRDQALNSGSKPPQMAAGTFIEIKRLVKLDLAGQTVTPAALYGTKDKNSVEYKTRVLQAAGIAPREKPNEGSHASTPPPAPVQQEVNGPLTYKTTQLSDQLPSAVNASSAKGRMDPNVLADVNGKAFDSLTVHLTEPSGSSGPMMIQSLFVPPGQRLVQIQMEPKGDPWAWADQVQNFSLVDKDGTKYPVNGVWGEAKMPDNSVHLFAQYQSDHPLGPTDKIEVDPKATPTRVWLAFLVPAANTNITELDFNGKKYVPLMVKLHFQ